MIVRLKAFGLGWSAAEIGIELELPQNATVRDAIAILKARGGLELPGDLEVSCTYIVNRKKAGLDDVLVEDDELMLLKILGGG